MDASENPYAPPPLDVEFATAEPIDDDAERIRREYLSHEASIRTIGILYYFGGGFLSLCCLGGIAGLFLDVPADRVELLALAGLYGALATLLLPTGRGLRTLAPWVRWPVGILSGLGLVAFPFGTLINGWILYLIFCRKGRMVFSPEYQEVMRRTPHIVYRSSVMAIILLAVLIAVLLAIIISLLMFG